MTQKFISFFAFILLLGLIGCKGSKKMASSETDKTENTEMAMNQPSGMSTTDAAPISGTNTSTSDPLPFDPDTRVGKLDNGLTYYIRKNAKPENFAELRLAVNAGSILEEDDQQGLAHFLEHMAFNGTKNFPKSDLVDYLEGIGTKFGAHLNAYTSFDETVYMLKIPTDDPEKFDKGLQIMEDWAHNITLDPEEIEKERGVVISEWRTRLGAGERIQRQTIKKTFYNSRYPDRLPIGKTDILETFKPEVLERFYKEWYRPELMAVVVVGDIEVDKVEAQIKEKFGRIAKSETPKERPVFGIPDHEETLTAIASDEEFPYNVVSFMYKQEHKEVKDMDSYRKSVMRQLASSMLQDRLTELTQAADPPFSFAFGGYSSMAREKDAFQMAALVAPGKFDKGLSALIQEQERAYKFGFTGSELERSKKSRLTSFEKRFAEKEKTESNRIVMNYVQHFLSGSPVMGIANTLEINKEILPGITLAEVNAEFKKMIRKNNLMYSINAAEKEGNVIPTEEELMKIVADAKAVEVTAYEDKVSDAPLLTETPAPGRIMLESPLDEVEATKFKLSNGATVIVKPTTFKDDEILMSAFSWGGSSLYSDEEYMSASSADNIISSSGLGGYDEIQLGKYMSDKVARVSPYISELNEGLQGSSSVKDLETMFQLVHLYFTQVRKDENAFAAYISQQKSMMGNFMSSPQFYFGEEVGKILNNNHPRRGFPSTEDMDKIKLDDVYRIYKERFADASDFTFVFVGNFEMDHIKNLIKNYLANLPSTRSKETFKDVGVEKMRGVVEKEFRKGKEPQSQVQLVFMGDVEYSSKASFDFGAARRVLSIMMRESMREDKGGVYGVQVYGGISRRPKEQYSMTISFTCDPKDAEDLIATALKDVKNLQENGPSEKNMDKIKEILRKEDEESLKQNRFWLNGISASVRNKTEVGKLLKQKEKIEALTADEVQAAAKQFMDASNFGKFILYPEEEQENR